MSIKDRKSQIKIPILEKVCASMQLCTIG